VRLLFPRSRVQGGDVSSVDRFKEVGKRLLDQHVLFDVVPDDIVLRRGYATVVSNVIDRLPSDLSHFDAPATVRVSASRPANGNELTLHFVNYNRQEPEDKKNRGSGIKDEKPIAAAAFQADLKLAPKQRAAHVEFLTPEVEQAQKLEFEQAGSRLRFRVPEFLVYAVVQVHLSRVE